MQVKLKWLRVILTAFVLFLPTFCIAANAEPEALVRTTINDMIHHLKAEHGRIQQEPNYLYGVIRGVIFPHIDFPEVSKRVLGVNYRQATPVQRQAFQKDFSELLVRTYAEAFRSYHDEAVDITDSHASASDANRVEVKTLIRQSGASPIPVDYRLVSTPQGWKVYDIVIEGISLVSSFRSQFSETIRAKGIPGLLQDLEDKNKHYSVKAKA
jgi:phospholipid transport system substrate-binding protein